MYFLFYNPAFYQHIRQCSCLNDWARIMFLVTKICMFNLFFFPAIIKHWSTSFASLMRFSTNASQFLNCTFLIHSVVLTVTVYCVQGLFGIIKKCSLKFSQDVSYKLFIFVVSVFIMFHDLTQNFYRNCTCMSAVMHYSYFKRILQYQYVPYCIIIWGLL